MNLEELQKKAVGENAPGVDSNTQISDLVESISDEG